MVAEFSSNFRRQVDEGIAVLKRGGVVAFPTDTVYGLGTAVDMRRAVEKVYALKKRPRSMPVSILLSSVSQISDVAESVSPVAWKLAEEFLPGAVTLVLSKSASVLDIITAGGKTVAVRIPNHPVPLALISGLGVPILGTSANVSGHPSALSGDEVSAQFGDKLDLVISGECSGGTESTVVDVTGDIPVILREGAIAATDIKRVCGNIKAKTPNKH